MSERIFDQGIARVTQETPPGMVTLRAAPDTPLPLPRPGQRRLLHAGDRAVLWMSPDELLVLCPRGEAAALVAELGTALAGRYHLAADVSDARAMFSVSGAHAREVLAKLAPVDLAPGVFTAGEIRRTRLAQVAAAIWLDEDGTTFRVLCFRSVAGYMWDLLTTAAAPASEVGHF